MPVKDSLLYGQKPEKKLTAKDISSSSSLAFSSQLSTLIAASKSGTKQPKSGQGRSKDDIFATHNKGSKKRSLKDTEDSHVGQKHSTSSERVDEATWHRAKRKMEEKARLYSAMKRGDIEDLDDKYGVDFDRKWTEAQERGSDGETSDGEDDLISEDEELVDYIDELGRSRKGTRAEAAREERRKETAAARAQDDRFTARPSLPTNVIYGDTIQTAAFNPDDVVTQQMADIAARRDHQTPPPDLHFDSKQEIRTKGVGFFQFSTDAEERKKQMEELQREGEEGEKRREQAKARKDERKKEMNERRKKILERRAGKQAERFLDKLGVDLSEKPP